MRDRELLFDLLEALDALTMDRDNPIFGDMQIDMEFLIFRLRTECKWKDEGDKMHPLYLSLRRIIRENNEQWKKDGKQWMIDDILAVVGKLGNKYNYSE